MHDSVTYEWATKRRTPNTMQQSFKCIGLSTLSFATMYLFLSSIEVNAHTGALNEQECHQGSRHYHCHRSSITRIRSSDLALNGLIKKSAELSPNRSGVELLEMSAPSSEIEVSSRTAVENQEMFFSYESAVPGVVKVLTESGHGTGFRMSVDEKEYIVTNYHVVDGFKQVGVQFHPNIKDWEDPSLSEFRPEIFIGQVARFDETKDLAAISLPADSLLPKSTPLKTLPEELLLEFLRVGIEVHAIGHPFGEDWTYTRGYISQIREKYSWSSELGKHHVADVIQTQTPINPGNSGGPLFSEMGHVVGVTTFGRSEPGAEGINFAVRMDEVIRFLKGGYNRRLKEVPPNLSQNLIGTRDVNKNGVIDYYVWDDNENLVPDVWGADMNEDNFIEEIFFDRNENKIVEVRGELQWDSGRFSSHSGWVMVYEFDDDEDGEFEKMGVDIDLDNKIDMIL